MVEKKKEKKSEKEENGSKPKKSGEKQKSSLAKIIFWIVAIVIGIFLIFLFINLKPETPTPETPKLDLIYNGFVFNKTPEFGLWSVVVKTPKGEIPIEFYYHPQQVENYTYNQNITRDVANMMLRQGKFLIAFDVNYSDKGFAAIAGSEVSRITGKVFGLETRSGFVDYVGDDAIPVINCSIVNYKNMVLEFRVGEENKIVYDNKYCITIYSSTPEDTVKLADFLDYKLLGIIPGKKQAENNSSDEPSVNSSASDNLSSLNKINVSKIFGYG